MSAKKGFPTKTSSPGRGAARRTTRKKRSTRSSSSASVAFSLGANLGDRTAALRHAVSRLLPALERPRVASLYRTAPLAAPPQPDFLNTAVAGRCAASPRELLALAHRIETEAGRVRHAPGGLPAPRLLDIDLIWWDDLVVAEPDLALPHPRARERRFVLEPLAEIAPRHRLAPDGASVAELLSRLLQGAGRDQAVERVAGRGWHSTTDRGR